MKQWHGHVTALTVQPTYRRLGLARKLMNLLEEVSERKNTWFVGKKREIFINQNIFRDYLTLEL
jgi:ribosomal protein S18 acetylase RimI-like enzyme